MNTLRPITIALLALSITWGALAADPQQPPAVSSETTPPAADLAADPTPPTTADPPSSDPATATEPTGVRAPILDAISCATPRYLPVVFSAHDAHATQLGIDCQTCHHEAVEGEPGACSACHAAPDATLDLTTVLHQTCRGCHREVVATNPQSTAPVQCLACHDERP